MVPCELEVVILIPVLEREVPQRRRVRELQVGEVPVQYLSVAHGQVHRAGDVLTGINIHILY